MGNRMKHDPPTSLTEPDGMQTESDPREHADILAIQNMLSYLAEELESLNMPYSAKRIRSAQLAVVREAVGLTPNRRH